MRDEKAYLFDMLESARTALEYVAGMTIEQFHADTKTQDAVVRRLTIIGEGAKKIPAGTRQSLPQVPFDDMARMRDKIIHTYWRTNIQIVWDTATKDLPVLIGALQAILPPARDTSDREVE